MAEDIKPHTEWFAQSCAIGVETTFVSRAKSWKQDSRVISAEVEKIEQAHATKHGATVCVIREDEAGLRVAKVLKARDWRRVTRFENPNHVLTSSARKGAIVSMWIKMLVKEVPDTEWWKED